MSFLLSLGHLLSYLIEILKVSVHIFNVRPWSLLPKEEEQTLSSKNCVCLFRTLGAI